MLMDLVEVAIRNVTKIYKTRKKKASSVVIANNAISCDVYHGEIFGILGENGAGKTTLVRQVATELVPTEGTITIRNVDVVKHPKEARRLIGVMPQESSPLWWLTPQEHVYFFGRLSGMAKQHALNRTRHLLDQFQLTSHVKKACHHLSGGLQRAVLLATAMVHEPPLLLLDEPTSGLDPAARKRLWHLLKEMRSTNAHTIILTTHYLEEALALCDRVAIIHQGELKAVGNPSQITKSVPGASSFEEAYFTLIGAPELAMEREPLFH